MTGRHEAPARLGQPATYAKAIVGGLVAGVAALGAGATDGHLTLAEWLVAAGAALGALAGVFGVSNGDPR